MNELFAEYDSADYLTNDEAILSYLNAAIEESDAPENIAHALSVVARARSRNMSQLAKEANISREGLYKVFSKNSNPSLATVVQIAKALGLRLAFKSNNPLNA